MREPVTVMASSVSLGQRRQRLRRQFVFERSGCGPACAICSVACSASCAIALAATKLVSASNVTLAGLNARLDGHRQRALARTCCASIVHRHIPPVRKIILRVACVG